VSEPLRDPPGTQPPAGLASALPRREAGTRSRAGNAMARTRAGLLDGALRAVAKQGTRRTTMNDIATQAGVAKATLYNHFRTKDDVWSALVLAEVDDLATQCADLPLADALAHAATRLSQHPALRQVADTEPAVLAGLLPTDPPAPGWRAAADALHRRFANANANGSEPDGRAAADTELVLRWLASYLSRPAGPDAIRAVAGRLAAVLAR